MKNKSPIKLIFLSLLVATFAMAFLACSNKSEIVEVQRSIPYQNVYEFLDESVVYPSQAAVLDSTEQNQSKIDALYAECEKLLNSNEAKGLTLEQIIQNGKLIKHPSIDLMLGAVSDDTPRVKKDITISPQGSTYIMTGLYAVAGETVSISIPAELKGRLAAVIAFDKGDIQRGQPLSRLPILRRQFALENEQTLIGTPFGGIIVLVRQDKLQMEGTLSISGAVQTAHYTLGVTGEREYKSLSVTGGQNVHLVAGDVQLILPKSIVDFDVDIDKALSFFSEAGKYLSSIKGSSIDAVICFDSYTAAPLKNVAIFSLEEGKKALDIDALTRQGAWDILDFMSSFCVSSLWADAQEQRFFLTLSLSLEQTIMGADELSQPLQQNERFCSYYNSIVLAKTKTAQSGFDALEQDVKLSMYAILAHRFGTQGTKAIFEQLSDITFTDNKQRKDKILLGVSKALGYDMRVFFEYFNFENSFECKDEVSNLGFPVFYPVAVHYTQNCFLVQGGASYKFDMSSSLITLYGEAHIISIKFSEGAFIETEEDVFVFTPLKNNSNVAGRLSVRVSTPSETIRLRGAFISVDESGSVHKVFTKAKIGTVYVVPVAKIFALVGSIVLGVLVAIALCVVSASKKYKKEKEQAKREP